MPGVPELGDARIRGADAGAWTVEPVDQAGTNHYALVLTSADVPHILYSQPNDPWGLRHAWKPASAWLTETADPTVAAGMMSRRSGSR